MRLSYSTKGSCHGVSPIRHHNLAGSDGDTPLSPRPPGTSPVGSPVGQADGPPSATGGFGAPSPSGPAQTFRAGRDWRRATLPMPSNHRLKRNLFSARSYPNLRAIVE